MYRDITEMQTLSNVPIQSFSCFFSFLYRYDQTHRELTTTSTIMPVTESARGNTAVKSYPFLILALKLIKVMTTNLQFFFC
jgi:hypothetical protein